MSIIMVIRHGEKPDQTGRILGVTEGGAQDAHELSVRGWERAGALAQLFSGKDRFPRPAALFATAVTHDKKSLRPQHTLKPLVEKLGEKLDVRFGEGDEGALVAAALEAGGDSLICWHHEGLPAIAAAILGPAASFPRKWPEERFDMVWVFQRQSGGWSLEQIPQLLLGGDRSDLIE